MSYVRRGFYSDKRHASDIALQAIKFLSDMFAARLYRMAAPRIGVSDYRTLVEQRLHSARNGRAFALELMAVIILVIDLVYLFRGK